MNFILLSEHLYNLLSLSFVVCFNPALTKVITIDVVITILGSGHKIVLEDEAGWPALVELLVVEKILVGATVSTIRGDVFIVICFLAVVRPVMRIPVVSAVRVIGIGFTHRYWIELDLYLRWL